MEKPTVSSKLLSLSDRHEPTGNLGTAASSPRRNAPDEHHREKAKVAFENNTPWKEIFIHSIALAIVGGLIGVNIAGFLWKAFEAKKQHERNVDLKAWQFGAKVHELLMLASLSSIIFYYMRKLLIGQSGIPFGLISAPHLTSSPSMLINASFWVGWQHHRPFGTLLFVSCILSFALGPSSAILMIPSLGWYDLGSALSVDNSTVYYTDSAQTIWPTVLNVSAIGLNSTEANRCLRNPFNPSSIINCPTAGFLEIFKWREVALGTDSSYGGTEAYATVVSELTSRSLGTYYSYAKRNVDSIKDISYPRLRIEAETPAAPLYQPAVYVQCQMTQWGGDSSRRNVTFPSIGPKWAGSNSDIPAYVDADDEIFDALPSETARFTWLKESGDNASSSLLALAIVPIVAANSTDDWWSSAIVACTTDARWAASNAYYQPMNSTTVSSNVSDSLIERISKQEESQKPNYALSEKPLDLQLDWAALLDANQTKVSSNSSTNTTAMVLLLNTAINRFDDDDRNTTAFKVPEVTAKDAGSAIEEAIAMLVGIVLADAISRSAQDVFPLYKSKSTSATDVVSLLQMYLIPDTDTTVDKEYLESRHSVRLKIDRYGYGYAIRNAASWVAVVTLLIYALVVIVHAVTLIIALSRKKYCGSSCWEDVAELVALAMNSAPSERLYGTSAGVEKLETYKSVVTVRDKGDEHLELCVGKMREDDGQTVVMGKKYL